jgi:hypothetical protein
MTRRDRAVTGLGDRGWAIRLLTAERNQMQSLLRAAFARPDRNRPRFLAECVRDAVGRAVIRDGLFRRRGLLLCDRVIAAQIELLQVADLLEHSDAPDPAAVATVHQLLTDGCESPLFNRSVHESELRAALHFARSRLSEPGVTPATAAVAVTA